MSSSADEHPQRMSLDFAGRAFPAFPHNTAAPPVGPRATSSDGGVVSTSTTHRFHAAYWLFAVSSFLKLQQRSCREESAVEFTLVNEMRPSSRTDQRGATDPVLAFSSVAVNYEGLGRRKSRPIGVRTLTPCRDYIASVTLHQKKPVDLLWAVRSALCVRRSAS